MRPSFFLGASVLALLAGAACGRRQPESAMRLSDVLPPVAPNELRTPEAFAVIGDKSERSKALFLEASRVLLHPRCANCHPDGDSPYQGTEWKPHDPPVVRGPEDKGVVGMECTSCHQDKNLELARVPGAPNWHVAPRSMAWVGRTPRAICEQLKDPARNGGKTLAQLVEHNGHDELVAWGWQPGAGREPAPGSQERFGAITAAWVETGAECPSEEARP
ncbi:Isoquinoline 1-oxidoreductase subunit [Hyalangium rubrum]|uniref:Isoquinoline 1-oxidoreductase subunit n=1 Tax=Hyalangium rubrum TaxID=3103134 RepID=A0ABU5H6W3_9BACT|nr:Isoquinoline 1-oxidoreductase subunit [Hyalangium sp. s54d21]MDY7228583.1 Isoquinoline 1-oxidoreductase subunit [Hyalangium sp. s54d21]